MLALWTCGSLILLAAAPVGVAKHQVFALLIAAANTLPFVGLPALISAAAGADQG